MKKLLLINTVIFYFVLNSQSQIIINKELIDSLITSSIGSGKMNYDTHIFVLKLRGDSNNKNIIFYTWGFAFLKEDIPKDIKGVYKAYSKFFIIRDTDVLFEKAFEDEIVSVKNQNYSKETDSLMHGYGSWDRVISDLDLSIYKVKMNRFNKAKYKVFDTHFIPYSSAPKEYWPVDKYTYPYTHIDRINYMYKDKNGNLNELYYQQSKDRSFIIRLSKK